MISVYPARSRTKGGCLNYSVGIRVGKNETTVVCAPPLAFFPLHGSSSPSLALWWGVLHALGRVGPGTEVRFLHFADWAAPRFTGSFGHVVRWLFFLCVQSDFGSNYWCCVERRFICVLAELFLLSFKIFSPGFVFFLNYTNDFFWYVCERH